jgi:hypothetical protein
MLCDQHFSVLHRGMRMRCHMQRSCLFSERKSEMPFVSFADHHPQCHDQSSVSLMRTLADAARPMPDPRHCPPQAIMMANLSLDISTSTNGRRSGDHYGPTNRNSFLRHRLPTNKGRFTVSAPRGSTTATAMPRRAAGSTYGAPVRVEPHVQMCSNTDCSLLTF